MTRNAAKVEAQMEAQRFTASQASREQAATQAWLNALERAGELVQAGYYQDARRVLELAKEAR